MMENSGFFDESDVAMILEFELNPLPWFEEDISNTRILNRYDDDFAIFVFENRTENMAGSNQHDYDVLYGVMSDSVPTLEIQHYKTGIKNREEVIASLKKQTSMKQLSLHNQDICDKIKLKEAYILDKATRERKELNVDDYRRQ